MKVLWLLLLSFSPAYGDSLSILGDSGINGPRYVDIQRQLQSLAAEHSDLLEYVVYGQSVLDRNLALVKIGKGQAGAPSVLITGATHGNEYLAIADHLPRAFVDGLDTLEGVRRFLERGGVIYVVPILNPDGYVRDRRTNSHNKDLNRDFPLIPLDREGFRQPETRSLANYLASDLEASGRTLDVSMDYHCCVGSLLYPWAYTNRSIPQEDRDRHKIVGQIMEDIFPSAYRYESWISALGYYANGTSQDYYYAQYGTLAFTFEGRYGVEDQRLEDHITMWDTILGSL